MPSVTETDVELTDPLSSEGLAPPEPVSQPMESEISFRLLFDNNPQPMWIYDAATLEFLAVNKAALAEFGYTRQEFRAMTMRGLQPAKNSLAATAPRQATPAPTASKISITLARKNGSTLDVELTRHRIFFMTRTAVLALEKDVTDSLLNRLQLDQQTKLLEIAYDAFLAIDLEGRITLWNKKAEALYGWSDQEALGKLRAEVFADEAELIATAREATARQGAWSGDLHGETKAGKKIVVAERWTLIRDQLGEPQSILIASCDITEKRALEAQALRTQRLESIGTLASGIAHDLNNILSPILMSAGLLRRTVPDVENQKLLNAIESSAERGADIVKQVLTFARGVEGDRILLQPRHLVGELVKIATQTFPKNITIRTSFPKDLWMVYGDATQLHQVLLNLCVNARDAMPDGGTLLLAAENLALGEDFVRENPDAKVGPHIALKVSDTGMGIPPEVVSKIYDPFFTTKEQGKGTGLGLSTVIGIVRSHGGVVKLESEVGKGTTFKVIIPATINAEEEDGNDGSQPVEVGRGEVILLVDDESSVRIAAVKTLEYNGYQVYTAEDGTDALALYFQRRAQIQLVLTDIEMELMDGVELIRRLKRFDPKVRVIVSSGQCHDAEKDEIQKMGVTRFLDKPYSSDQLLTVVYEELHPVNAPAS
ncbi:MAG: PAS domain S-box protein [Verrucomicrobiota bacterium]|nr:PAS domain S-box protein [Verrucomicrobiota bacterium]